jgi:hypothetical protein
MTDSAPQVRPVPAVEWILGIAHRYPIVALGEAHGCVTEHEFICDLLRHPQLPEAFDHIVIEFANALHQAVLDRYIGGEEVDMQELTPLLRDTTAALASPERDPLYVRLLDTVREVNRESGSRLRVLAGDPPIDWNRVNRPSDFRTFVEARAQHYADRAVGRCLLVIGGMHLMRGSNDVADLIQRRRPGALVTVVPHASTGESTRIVDLLASSVPPAIVGIRGSSLETLAWSDLNIRMIWGTENHLPPRWTQSPLGALIDALLYLGPPEQIRWSELNDDNPSFADERERRQRLAHSAFEVERRRAGLLAEANEP